MSDEKKNDVQKSLDNGHDVIEFSKALRGLLNVQGDRHELLEYLRKLGKFHSNDDLFRYAQIMGIHHAMISEIPLAMKTEADRLESVLKDLRTEESHFVDIMDAFHKTVETSIDESTKYAAGAINKQIFKTLDESGMHEMVNLMMLTTTEVGFSNSELQTTLHALNDAVDNTKRHISYLAKMCESSNTRFYWGSVLTSFVIGGMMGGIVIGLLH